MPAWNRVFDSAVLLGVGALVSACSSAPPKPVPPPREVTVEQDSAPPRSRGDLSPLTKKPVELRIEVDEGLYVRRRQGPEQRRKVEQTSLVGTAEVFDGTSRCVPLHVERDGRQMSLEVDGLRYDLHGSDGDWTVRMPTAKVRGSLVLAGVCRDSLRVSSVCADGCSLSNAGPVFADRRECERAGEAYVKTCRAGECSYDEPRAQPFEISECAEVVDKLKAMADELNKADYGAAERSLALLQRGGGAWQFQTESRSCQRARFRRIRGKRFEVVHRYSTPTKRVTSRKLYTLRPMFGEATELAASQSTTYKDGSGGSGSGSGATRTGLLVGDGVVGIGQAWFFSSRAACLKHGDLSRIRARPPRR